MDNLESIGRIYLTFRGEGGISGYDQRSIGLGVREGCQTPPWSLLLLHPSVFLMPTDAALYQCSSSTLIEYSQTYIISNPDPASIYNRKVLFVRQFVTKNDHFAQRSQIKFFSGSNFII